jgi:hypothetical protein
MTAGFVEVVNYRIVDSTSDAGTVEDPGELAQAIAAGRWLTGQSGVQSVELAQPTGNPIPTGDGQVHPP